MLTSLKKIKWVLLLALFSLGYCFGDTTPYSEQIQALDSLRQTAVLIFGVVGAWVAVLYPLTQDKKTSSKEAVRITDALFTPLTYSLYILMCTLVLPVIVAIGARFDILVQYKDFFKGGLFGILAVLTSVQVYSLLLALKPFDIVKTRQDLNRAKAKVEERAHSRSTI